MTFFNSKFILRHTFAFFYVILISCSSDKDATQEEEEENPPSTNIDIATLISSFDTHSEFTITQENNSLNISTNNLPNHTSPYWPTSNPLYEVYNGSNSNFNKNPNTIQSQNISLTIPRYPEEASSHESTPLGAIGIARNGVVFYNQYAGPNQPLTNEINSFDQWLGHPQNQGAYHYHIEPTYMTELYGKDAFLGLLADGFPVYGPVENETTVTNSDLDEYHGHFGPTDDFPDGIYHYHITDEDPYLNGNGYYGIPGNITN